jgi:hypothetical protein
MWCSPQPMGCSITSTRAVIPQFLQNPVAWIRKNLKLQKRNLNVWNPPALFAIQNHHGHPLSTWFPKKTDPGDLVAIIAVSIWRQLWTSTLCQTCKTFPMACMVATFFQKSILSRVITKFLLQLQTSQKQQLSCHLACLSICSRHLDCLTLHRHFKE